MDDEAKLLWQIQTEMNKNQDKINSIHNKQLDIIMECLKDLRERIERLEEES